MICAHSKQVGFTTWVKMECMQDKDLRIYGNDRQYLIITSKIQRTRDFSKNKE